MAVVYSSALLQHIFRLSFRRVGRAVGIDVRADVGKQVLAVAGFGYRRAQSTKLDAMFGEEFTVAGEVVLFECGGGKGGFGVEEAGELGDE
jgi:hypothetical protein